MAGRQANKAAPDDPASIILRVIERISWRFPGFVLFDSDRRRRTAGQQVSYTVNLSRECRGPGDQGFVRRGKAAICSHSTQIGARRKKRASRRLFTNGYQERPPGDRLQESESKSTTSSTGAVSKVRHRFVPTVIAPSTDEMRGQDRGNDVAKSCRVVRDHSFTPAGKTRNIAARCGTSNMSHACGVLPSAMR
jgi:hypothetical protein